MYRRERRDRPNLRWRRVIALAGTILFHLFILFFIVLGPAYEPSPPKETPSDALQVRLITQDQKKEPPPPPPVRGTPPKKQGPLHKGSALAKAEPRRSSNTAAGAPALTEPTPVPAKQEPVVADEKPSAPKAQKAVAPKPPRTLPKPAPAPELQAVAVDSPPPTVTLEQPPTAPPVPPKFQPEPVRKPQREGNQAMPPPPSIATPETPPQSAPSPSPPTIAAEHPVTQPTPPSVATPEHPQAPASPPVPPMDSVPVAAQPAPAVNMQADFDVRKAVAVPHERPQVASPSIKVADVELEAVPLPDNAHPRMDRPQISPIRPQVKAGAIARPDIVRPEISAAPAPDASADHKEASTAPSQSAKAAEGSKSEDSASTPASTAGRDQDVSTAPNARPTGSDSATPGEREGSDKTTAGAGRNGLDLRLPTAGQGSGQGGHPGAGQTQAGNSEQGAIGQYIQLKPRGNTDVMSHGTPNIGYKATRFEKDWTPEGESSVDTALRHVVEKTTVRHTFHLAPGVRVECVVMPLFPMALFGCAGGDKPPQPVADKVYERMKLAPANPLVPPKPAASTAASAQSPVKLDNSVDCVNARISGGPLPPGCLDDKLSKPATPPAQKSWVPASDQFH